MMSLGELVERLLKQERLIIITSLLAVVGLAWIYLFILSLHMEGMMAENLSTMAQPKSWTAIDGLLMFIMWAVMMVGMMVPSASPTILLYARVCRKKVKEQPTLIPTAAFLMGYLAIWTVFSAIATILQWCLEQVALLSPMMASTSFWLGGTILVAAGIYQLTPYKSGCLQHCRSPIDFLATHWREGNWGAFNMGIRHGVFCLGCCWALMLLLFVVGVMNLLGVAAITIFVLLEKVTQFGLLVRRLGGFLLIVWGIVLVVPY